MKGRRVTAVAWIFVATTFIAAPMTTSAIGRSKEKIIVFSSGVDGSMSNGRVMAGSNSVARTSYDDFDYNVSSKQQDVATLSTVATATTPIVTGLVAASSIVLAMVMDWMEEEEAEKSKVKWFPLSEQVGFVTP